MSFSKWTPVVSHLEALNLLYGLPGYVEGASRVFGCIGYSLVRIGLHW